MAKRFAIYPGMSKFERLICYHKIPREKVADAVGVSGAAITGWIKEQNKPRIDHLVSLAEFFNITPEEMLSYFLTPRI